MHNHPLRTEHCALPAHSISPPRCLPLRSLLGERNELLIEHNGSYYCLRLTRQNKLILTK
ncbi:MAG: hemin uptake protein HemP [Halopseudomonas yangmingensis]|uniref:Hemin uptake protein hemP n=1 Tax=Halopseudomonas yangmingensis TaxID=1720063 RepID=A0A1I4RXJ9_9GAMM|nr:hemin uptake protein HemP [Halopseudomonas yangmingensis]SFM56975.1 Hemin uptake protein hemP [Halopseudomonas yangmingensis]